MAVWGSDEDLARSLGINLRPELRDQETSEKPRLAPVVLPPGSQPGYANMDPTAWKQHMDSTALSDLDMKYSQTTKSPTAESAFSARKVSFFDVGGLLEEGDVPSRSLSSTPIIDMYAQSEPTASTDLEAGEPSSPQTSSHIRRDGKYQSIGSRLTLADLNKPLPDLPIFPMRGHSWQAPTFRHSLYEDVQPLQDVGGLLKPGNGGNLRGGILRGSRHSVL